ncbi:MAG: hypothetical protein ACI8W3_001280 [Myxococcota bacterium]|jgi:hypothetical protein
MTQSRNSPSQSLAELQALLSELIRAPRGVAQGVRDLVAEGKLASEDLSFAIKPNAKLRADERLDIYASMYFYRLHDCIAQDHEATLAHIGPANFNNLITDYLLAHPPSHYSLNTAGAALPQFTAEHPLHQQYPALADLALLERTRFELFDAADAPPLGRDGFLEASSSNPDFAIRLVPAARLIHVGERALELFRDPSLSTNADAPAAGRKNAVVVWRKGFAVFHRRCQEDEERCLQVLSTRDISLEYLAELLLKPDASAERTSERFASLLQLWLDNEILAAVRSTDEA